MKLKTIGPYDGIPLRPGPCPVIEQVRVASLHQLSGPEVGGLDSRLGAAGKADLPGVIRLVSRDPLKQQAGVVLCLLMPVERKLDSISRDEMRGEVGELDNCFQKTIIV